MGTVITESSRGLVERAARHGRAPLDSHEVPGSLADHMSRQLPPGYSAAML
jgi:hypothetical protein